MAVLNKTNFLLFTDGLAASMILALGDSGGGCGDNDVAAVDDTGARGRLGDLEVALLDLEDGDYVEAIKGLRDSIAKAGYQNYVQNAFDKGMDALTTLCADAGISGVASINNFAKYWNTGQGAVDSTPWGALVAPQFRTLIFLVDAVTLDAINTYALPATLASRSIASSALGSLTDTAAVDDTKYAGAARAQAVISGLTFASGITTSGLTVTGKARKKDGTIAEGRTWTGTITANGTITLMPTVAGDLLLDVTDIQFGAGMTAVTAQINAAAPAGRTYPPA